MRSFVVCFLTATLAALAVAQVHLAALDPATLEYIKNVDNPMESGGLYDYCLSMLKDTAENTTFYWFLPYTIKEDGEVTDVFVRCSRILEWNATHLIQHYFDTFPRAVYSRSNRTAPSKCVDETDIYTRILYGQDHPCFFYYHYSYTPGPNFDLHSETKLSGPALATLVPNFQKAASDLLTNCYQKSQLLPNSIADRCFKDVSLENGTFDYLHVCCCKSRNDADTNGTETRSMSECRFGETAELKQCLHFEDLRDIQRKGFDSFSQSYQRGSDCSATIKIKSPQGERGKYKYYINAGVRETAVDSLHTDNYGCHLKCSSDDTFEYTCFCKNNLTHPCNADILSRLRLSSFKFDGSVQNNCQGFPLSGALDEGMCYVYFNAKTLERIKAYHLGTVALAAKDAVYGNNYKKFANGDGWNSTYMLASYNDDCTNHLNQWKSDLLVAFHCNSSRLAVPCDVGFTQENAQTFLDANQLSCPEFSFNITKMEVYKMSNVKESLKKYYYGNKRITNNSSYICVIKCDIHVENEKLSHIEVVGGNMDLLDGRALNKVLIEKCTNNVYFKGMRKDYTSFDCYHNYDRFPAVDEFKKDNYKHVELILQMKDTVIAEMQRTPTFAVCPRNDQKEMEECSYIKSGCFGTSDLSLVNRFGVTGCTDQIGDRINSTTTVQDEDHTVDLVSGTICDLLLREGDNNLSQRKCFVNYISGKQKMVCCCKKSDNYEVRGDRLACSVQKPRHKKGKTLSEFLPKK